MILKAENRSLLISLAFFTFLGLSQVSGVLYGPIEGSECNVEGDRQGVWGRCRRFYQCDNGSWVKNDCPVFMCFNAIKGACEIPSYHLASSLQETIDNVKNTSSSRRKREATTPNPAVCSNYAVKPSVDCSKYLNCVDGQYVETSCPSMQYFDYALLMCRFYGQATCAPQSCMVGEKRANLTDCTSYSECETQGNTVALVQKKCSLWRRFDSVKKKCVWLNVTCGTASPEAECTEGETRGTSGSTNYETCFQGEWLKRTCTDNLEYTQDKNGCSCDENSRKAIDNFPTFYLECNSGKWIVNECLLNGTFDEDSLVCTLDGRYRRSVQLDARSNTTSCTSGETAWSDSPGVCSSYRICNDGKFELRDCPKGEKFNGKKCSEAETCSFESIPGQCDQFKDGDKAGTCEFGNRFDENTRECIHYSLATCSNRTCVDAQKKNHPNDCSKYLECQNGQFVEKKCDSWSNSYDWIKGECVRNTTNCRYDPSECTDGDKKTIPPKSPEIPMDLLYLSSTDDSCDTEGEVRKVNGTCRLYEKCSKGSWERKKCSPCQNFQEEEKKCDWVWKNPCPNNVTDNPTESTTQAASSTSVTEASSTPTPITDATTTENVTPVPCTPGAKTARTEDCISYLQCDENGTSWVLKTCPKKLFFIQKKFDSNSLKCVFFNYQCLGSTSSSLHTAAPTTNTPTTEASSSEPALVTTPLAGTPTTEATITDAPTTEASSTAVPTNAAPITVVSTTEASSTAAPTNAAPITDASTTEASSTAAPTNAAPITDASTTEASSTAASTTADPISTTTETFTTVACTPGDKKARTEDCISYLECDDNGSWVLNTCPVKLFMQKKFDCKSLTCVFYNYQCLGSTSTVLQTSSTEKSPTTTTETSDTEATVTVAKATTAEATVVPVTEASTTVSSSSAKLPTPATTSASTVSDAQTAETVATATTAEATVAAVTAASETVSSLATKSPETETPAATSSATVASVATQTVATATTAGATVVPDTETSTTVYSSSSKSPETDKPAGTSAATLASDTQATETVAVVTTAETSVTPVTAASEAVSSLATKSPETETPAATSSATLASDTQATETVAVVTTAETTATPVTAASKTNSSSSTPSPETVASTTAFGTVVTDPTTSAPELSTEAEQTTTQLCTPGTKKAISGDCYRYLECDDTGDEWVTKKCSQVWFVKRKFDYKSLKCVLTGAHCL